MTLKGGAFRPPDLVEFGRLRFTSQETLSLATQPPVAALSPRLGLLLTTESDGFPNTLTSTQVAEAG